MLLSLIFFIIIQYIASVCTHFLIMNDSMLVGDNSVMLLS